MPPARGQGLAPQHLETLGAQVLDLERLAVHRGSVLGNLPGQPQPAQKMFESRIWNALRSFDPLKPVFVESESKRIGALHVPEDLMAAMWTSVCVRMETATALRVSLLREQYEHFLGEPAALGAQLDCLTQRHGHAVIERWKQMAQDGDWNLLVTELLERHYDPAYSRSILSHYPGENSAPRIVLTDGSEASFEGSHEWDRRERIPLLHKDPTRLPRVHRRALGLLFTVLAAGLGSIAVLSALEGGRAWAIALDCLVVAVVERSRSTSLAIPKSSSLTWPSLLTSTLAGLMSRWTIRFAWA